jgi:hypothetical protein
VVAELDWLVVAELDWLVVAELDWLVVTVDDAELLTVDDAVDVRVDTSQSYNAPAICISTITLRASANRAFWAVVLALVT